MEFSSKVRTLFGVVRRGLLLGILVGVLGVSEFRWAYITLAIVNISANIILLGFDNAAKEILKFEGKRALKKMNVKVDKK